MAQKPEENKKESAAPKKSTARQIPIITTKDTNDAGKIPLELSRDIFEEPEDNAPVRFTSEYPSSGDYSRSRTIDGTMLPKDRFKKQSSLRSSKSTTIMMLDSAERFNPDVETGLSAEQVEHRVANGYVNVTRKKTSKSYGSIFFSNIVTPINVIAAIVATALVIFKTEFSQLFFVIIIAINMGIGIFQEIRAKMTIEKLNLMTAPTAVVIRDGEKRVIPVTEVVLDDIMYIEAGKQICADAIVVKGEAEANESMLTGESVQMKKAPGAELFSGSFLTSGSCYARVNKIGSANYVETLTSHAKKYKKPKSELFNSVNLIIKVVIPIALVITAATIVSYYLRIKNGMVSIDDGRDPWQDNIQRAAAVMIGMLPTGMFLLTSTALFVSVVRLGNRRTLVKDLYCIEMLARVNVLCLDKTGTITDGTMSVKEVIEIKGGADTQHTFSEIIGSVLTATGDNNQTAMALANRFGYSQLLKPTVVIPFSSQRKLAAVTFGENGTFLYGAPEFVLKDVGIRIEKLINEYASQGFRVLVLAHSPAPIVGEKLPAVRRPLCLLVIEDHIREDAVETVKWFKENSVSVKVISGDNPITVSEVARRVGVEKAELYISLDGLSNQEVMEAATKYTVFGRVTPEQKMLLIKTLKQKGNTVAMTGDGVNDILAMRESDCAVAIASGAEAARNVAHIVLQDSNFTSMPQVVMEGRRVVNNIQQSSSLFLMKTFMTILLAVVFLFMQKDYPYKTNNLLLLEFFVIAAASFALALQKNKNLITGKFLSNVIGRSAPGGITLTVSMLALYYYRQMLYGTRSTGDAAYDTMLVIGVSLTGFMILIKICEPPNMFRIVMLIIVGTFLALGIFVMPVLPIPDLFGITPKSLLLNDILYLIVTILGAYFFVSVLIRIMRALKILN